MPESTAVIPPSRVRATVAVVVAWTLAVDQVTKYLAIDRYIDNPPRTFGPFHIHLVANRGALMGLPLPNWLLFVVAALLVRVAVSGLTGATSRASVVGYALLVGGAAGNIMDRFQHRSRFPDHAVVDWVASNALPTFNLADLAIACGLVILVVGSGRTPAVGPTRTRRALVRRQPTGDGAA